MSYQIRYDVPNIPFEILATCETTTDVHREMEYLTSLFGRVGKCSCCGGPAVPKIRVVKPDKERGKKGGTYYEWWCDSGECRAKVSLHSFDPDKSGKKGLYLKWDEGFEIWEGEKKAEPPI